MRGFFPYLLKLVGIDARSFFALTRALILMDLRSQHYAAATASKPGQLVSPLFLVVGQCLTLSMLTSLYLFTRVDIFFFAFVHLAITLVIIASTILVEFQEVVLNSEDLEVLGFRPLTPRTYAAARLANLLFYFGLMYLGLNLFPLVVGAGMREAGVWYIPAYLAASLAGSLAVMAVVVVGLSFGKIAGRMEAVKMVLAWTQIIILSVVFYGILVIFNTGSTALLVWGAFPPAWIKYLPATWLARVVEEAAVEPDRGVVPQLLLLVLVGLASLGLTLGRVAWLNRRMHPATRTASRRPMSPAQVGSLRLGPGSWLARGPEERIGYWMCLTILQRDPDLLMRSVTAFAGALLAVALGLFTNQFANPCTTRDVSLIALPVLGVFLIAMGMPTLVHNLTFCRDSEGSWLWSAAPLRHPAGVAHGACKAVMLWVVTPCCCLLGGVAWFRWGDAGAALLHALLAWVLAWLAILASLWLIAQALPFSLSPQRGGSLSLPPLPLFALSAATSFLGVLHYLFAGQPAYWFAIFPACVGIHFWLRGRAVRRLGQLARPS
jgi:ABC-2 type transport system permease protein